MTEEQYEHWTAPLRAHPRATRALLAVNKLLTIVGYVAYPLLLTLLALEVLGVWDGGSNVWAGGIDAWTGGTISFGSGGAESLGGASGTDAPGDAGILESSSQNSARLLVRCIVVPAIAFAAVSTFRRICNAPRPYEALDIQPLIAKDTRGKSFPSRHTFSMFMIAVSWLAYQPIAGCALLAAGTVMGSVRVLGGVHFPRDVIVGALAAIAAGLVGYVLIP